MFFNIFHKTYTRIVLSTLIAFVVIETLIVLGALAMDKKDTKLLLQNTTARIYNDFRLAQSNLEMLSHAYFDLEINIPEVISLMHQATATDDPKKLQKIRQKLYTLLSPTYGYQKKHLIRQLHFHLPGNISFLRFHKPEKYGDSLKGIRESIDYVNETKTPISSFEEGRIFNGFRNVYPLFDKQQFIGTVEISYSFAALKKQLLALKNTSALFLMDKKVIDAKVFSSEKDAYVQSAFQEFAYEKSSLSDDMQFRLATLRHINRLLPQSVNRQLAKGKSFSILFHHKDILENKNIVISFIAISNLNNQTVAYMIHYEFASFIDIVLEKNHFILIALTLILLVVNLFFAILLNNERKKQLLLKKMATHDPLTKIYNRHGLNELIDQKIEEFKRFGHPLSVIFFDIDFFKKINDSYGHDIGDYVLKNIASLVKNEIRQSDIFGRWGGEEFIIFLPETTLKDAIRLAEKLRAEIESHAFYEIDNLTCSFGVTQLRQEQSKSALIKEVDTLLYRAKNSGRNCVVSYSESQETKTPTDA